MGHFSGKFEKDLIAIIKKAKGREGIFYQIFNKYGYYDVSDENNTLTPEQRESVNPINSNRYTQMSNAIADMIAFVLGDEEAGMFTKSAQDTVDDIDTATQMSNSQLDGINNGLKAVPGGQGIAAGMESIKSLMGAILGKTYYNVNILPQFTFGLDGFEKLGDLGNLLKPGQLRPNWNFLYDNENVRSDKFFANDRNLKIGANIDVTELNDLQLKKIFGVVSADEDLNPIGDIKGGVSQQEFNIIRKASNNPVENNIIRQDGEEFKILDSEVKDFRLNDAQMRASFNNYAEMKLWNVIKNPKNWAHGHWGALTHNALPEYVKTAVTSFIWTNGMAIEQGKSEDGALISYLLTIGLFYLIGFQHRVRIFGFEKNDDLDFPGDRIINAAGGIEDLVGDSGDPTRAKGLPKDDKLAKRYFIWIADVLSRLTYNNLPVDLANKLRARRVAEANLIYDGTGLPNLPYGESISKLPFEHTIEGWKQRKLDVFFKEISNSFFRYKNEGSPGGIPELGDSESSAILTYGVNAPRIESNDNPIDIIENYIKSLMDKAGVGSIKVTSTQRTKSTLALVNILLDMVSCVFGGLINI